jgi:hypothetical protein
VVVGDEAGSGHRRDDDQSPCFPSWRCRAGPRWVRTASGTAGPRRAQVVTTGTNKPQVVVPSRPGPRPLKQGGKRLRIPPPQPPRGQLHHARSERPSHSAIVPRDPRQPPSCAWFEGTERWGTTMPLARDSPSIQGDVPGPDPPGLPPSKAVAGRVRLSGAAGGVYLARQGPRRGAPPPPRARRAWPTFGPHAIGTERFSAVTKGMSFVQVAGAVLRKQARVQNPDEDELRAVRRRRCFFGAGWDQRASATIPHSSGWWDRLVRSLRVARSACRRSPRPCRSLVLR